MKVYSVTSRIEEFSATTVIALDKEVLVKYIEEHIKPIRGLSLLSEIQEQNQKSAIYLDHHRGPFSRFLTEGAIRVGECHQDAKCSGMYSYYTVSEYLALARQEFEKKRAGQNARADSYYSQIWV